MRTLVELPACIDLLSISASKGMSADCLRYIVTVDCCHWSIADAVHDFLTRERSQHPIVAECERLREQVAALRAEHEAVAAVIENIRYAMTAQGGADSLLVYMTHDGADRLLFAHKFAERKEGG